MSVALDTNIFTRAAQPRHPLHREALDALDALRQQWERLVLQHAVSGKNAHDAHVVAAMRVHGITHLLAFNADDFTRFSGIIVLTPAGVLHRTLSTQPTNET